MTGFPHRHLLGIEPLEAPEIETILDTAQGLREVLDRPIKKVPALRGKTVVNLFYESSTRTRASFEVAEKVLSADSLSISSAGSSVSKGETLLDTARNLEAMRPDLIVMRHAASGAPHFLARHCGSSIVNAGDGAHEHPTQALLDALTLRQRKRKLRGLRVAIVGDIVHSRVVRSNLWLLTKLGAKVTLCAPPTLMPPGIEALASVTSRIEEALDGADAIMMLRIQLERMTGGFFPSVREYHARFGLTAERVKLAKEDVLIMHPGPPEPRGGDLQRGRRRALLGDPRPGHKRRGRPHGRVAAAARRCGGGRLMTGWSQAAAAQGRAGHRSLAEARCHSRREPGGRRRRRDRPAHRGTRRSDDRRVGQSGLPGLHRSAHPPSRAGSRGQGDHRDRHPGRGGRRFHRGLRHAQHTAGQRQRRVLTRGLLERASREAAVRLYPIGAITQGSQGEELAEYADLREAGCVAVSDDGKPVVSARMMRRALEYAQPFELPVIDHCEEPTLAENAQMHEGPVSTNLGLRGAPAAAEAIVVERDVLLAELTGGRLHVAHVSAAASVDAIRRGKARRVRVTAEVTPHHLLLTDQAVKDSDYDTHTKVSPPLRGELDRQALIEALRDGTIDCIATDHAPHLIDDKRVEYDAAACGIVGLETAVALCHDRLVRTRISEAAAARGDAFQRRRPASWGFRVGLSPPALRPT